MRLKEAARAFSPAILWSTLIFLGSTDLLSTKNTAKLIQPELAASEGIPCSLMHYAIRKLGHIVEFAILYFLILLGSNSIAKRHWPHWNSQVWCALLSTFYAILDEWHQSFVPTRTGQLKDVLVDFTGVISGMLVIEILQWRARQYLNKSLTKREMKM